jgi:hypothetical protein
VTHNPTRQAEIKTTQNEAGFAAGGAIYIDMGLLHGLTASCSGVESDDSDRNSG